MISAELEKILQRAYVDARNRSFELITLEHLLLTLMSESADVAELFDALSVDKAVLKKQLEDSMRQNTPVLPKEVLAQPKPSPRSVSSGYCSGRWYTRSRRIRMK